MAHTLMTTKRVLAHLCALLGLCCFSAAAGAAGMQALDDVALSDIEGRGGVSMLIGLKAEIGSHIIGVYDPYGDPASLNFNNIVATGVIGSTMDIVPGAPGSPDVINFVYAKDIGGVNIMQIAFDMVVSANNPDLGVISNFGTSMTFQDWDFSGSSMQLTTPGVGNGVVFGLGMNLAIGNVFLQPNGRGNSSGQMSISGIKFGDVDGVSPWVLADVNSQPGSFHVVDDGSGVTHFEYRIDWPTATNEAAKGSLQIGNVTFNTPVTLTNPTGTVNLGSSGIGSMQIQYLNVRIKS